MSGEGLARLRDARGTSAPDGSTSAPAGSDDADAGSAIDAPTRATGTSPGHPVGPAADAPTGAGAPGGAPMASGWNAGPPAPPEPQEPGEETPDGAALATVSTRDDEVLVIDEEPRFHLDRCGYLYGRDVIPLPVSEALELGFTGCSWCAPVTALAEQHGADTRR